MNKTLKTLLVSAPYFPPYGGGLERYAYEISTRLSKKYNWKIIVVTSGPIDSVDTKEEVEGLIVYRLSTGFKVSNTPFSFNWFPKIRQIIKDEKPDLINIHMPVPGIGDVVSFLAKEIPIFVTYHSATMLKNKSLFNIPIWFYEKTLLKIILNKANTIITSSDYLKEGFLVDYKDKSVTITPAVDSDFFKPDISKKNKKPTLLFIAGLSRSEQYKGLGVLINKIKKLKSTFDNIQLTVVGDGDMRVEYEDLVKRLGLDSNVIFKGRLYGEKLLEEYQKSTIFVLPSSNESFSMVVLEAMSCGLPVVANKVGDISKLIEDGKNGYVVRINDTKQLLTVLMGLLNNENYQEDFGNRGREKAIKNYTWDERVEKYNNLFLNVNNNKSIVQIAPYYPPHTGGLERVAQMCSEELSKRGYSVQVITTTNSGRKNGVEKINDNLEIKTLWSFEFAHTSFAPSLFWHLLKIPKKSIVHLHLSQAYFPELVMLVCKLRGIPYIVHFHLDVDASGFFGPIFLLYKKILWGPFMRNSKKVIACGNDQLEIIPRKFNVQKDKIEVITNAVSENFFCNRNYLTPQDNFKLLYIGRLVSQKRIERIVQAVSKLDIPFTLSIVGDGEDEQKIKNLAKELKVENVSFEGKKNDVEIKQYHKENDLFIISSDKEGLPLSVLEAMAGGMPILSTDVEGLHDLLFGTAVLVKEPFSDNLSNEIGRLWKNKEELVEMSKKSLEKSKEYNQSKFIDKLIEVYTSI